MEYYNPDPNGDDFSLDPSGDNWNDYGSDGCPDELENGFGGCLEEGELATVPDPNEDNFDDIFNDQGSQGNNSFDAGEGYEDNLQYDYDSELDKNLISNVEKIKYDTNKDKCTFSCTNKHNE